MVPKNPSIPSWKLAVGNIQHNFFSLSDVNAPFSQHCKTEVLIRQSTYRAALREGAVTVCQGPGLPSPGPVSVGGLFICVTPGVLPQGQRNADLSKLAAATR